MRITLTRSVAFRARHRLAHPHRSAAENRAAWGALAETHAHDYACQVSVSGAPHPETGMVVDLALLDRILADEVGGRFDGGDLNHLLAAVRAGTALPVCETIALELFGRISARLPDGVTLERVRVAEDASLSAECAR
jgi:6-pyruvoyltetrahydropterin/6-carboxytetrahydropterin synthase